MRSLLPLAVLLSIFGTLIFGYLVGYSRANSRWVGALGRGLRESHRKLRLRLGAEEVSGSYEQRVILESWSAFVASVREEVQSAEVVD